VKILLDECVPFPLSKILNQHLCRTATQMGWTSIRNGELLDLAEGQFDVFITADQGLPYQQNLTGRRIAILELSTNNIRLITAAAGLIREALASIQPAELRRLQIPR
jgi:predicted nuclease of predicted toxin-antitoxin system